VTGMDRNKARVVGIIQARMGSERLPGKVMMDICGKPVIAHVIERLKRCTRLDQIVLATTQNEEDKVLLDLAKKLEVGAYAGSESDVLGRYIEAAELYNADIAVRVTGDCPLIDPYIVDELIYSFEQDTCDYMRLDVPETYSRGLDAEIFTMEALKLADKLAGNDSKYREHVTFIIYQKPDTFSICKKEAPPEIARPQYRFCIDTPEDFELVKQVFERLSSECDFITAADVIKLLDSDERLASINASVKQRI